VAPLQFVFLSQTSPVALSVMVPSALHMYPGTQHGFHNNSTPRYHEASARLDWDRTIAFFKKHLA
jgi:dienelactone hydrolase